jgi:hypothetical protein
MGDTTRIADEEICRCFQQILPTVKMLSRLMCLAESAKLKIPHLFVITTMTSCGMTGFQKPSDANLTIQHHNQNVIIGTFHAI